MCSWIDENEDEFKEEGWELGVKGKTLTDGRIGGRGEPHLI